MVYSLILRQIGIFIVMDSYEYDIEDKKSKIICIVIMNI